MKYFYAILLLSLSNCSTLAFWQPSDEEIAKLEAQKQMYSPTCPAPEGYAGCADITDKFKSENEYAGFKAAGCKNIKEDECQSKAQEMLLHRYKRQYNIADVDDVLSAVKAIGPTATDKQIELEFVASHNKGLNHLVKRQIAEIERESSERWAGAMRGLAQGMKENGERNRTTTCTSSSPDYFGNVRTTCN